MNEMSISRSKFELDEMADLIAYVYSASVPKEYDVVYSPSGNPSRGRGLIVEYECIRCHSIYEESGKIGPPLSARNHDRSVSQLAGTMWNHSTDIILRTLVQEKINIRRLTSAGMADIAAYLFFVGYFSPPGDGKKGEEVFVDKGCSRCHTVRGVGGALGPDLSKYGGQDTYFQPVLFAQSMWNHAPMMAEAMKKLMVTWPRFEKQEMDDLLAYLRRSDDNH